MVDAGESQVLERGLAQELKEALLRCLRRKCAVPNLVEQGAEISSGHRSK